MNLHNLQTRLGFFLAGMSLVFAVGFFASQVDGRSPVVTGPDIPQSPSLYTEVMPETSGESYRIHVQDATGAETQVQIKFLDGSEGLLRLYPDGDTKEEVRLFLDGSVRKQASYDAHGQVTEGFEYRANRTLVWKAFPYGAGKTVTQSFWPNGRPFLERTYDPERKTTSIAFYRENGAIWQETVSVGDDVLTSMRMYDENTRLRMIYSLVYDGVKRPTNSFSYDVVKSPVIQVLYLDADGNPDFDQQYGYAADYYYDPASGVPNPNRLVVKSVGVYDNGALVGRVYLSNSGNVQMIDNYRADSTIDRSHVQTNGNITLVEQISPGGSRSSQYDFEGKFGKAPPLDNHFRVPLPDRTVPFKLFDAAEKAHQDEQ